MNNYSEKESVKVGKASMKLAGAEFINVIFGIFYFLIITRTFSKIEMASVAVMSVIMNISAIISAFGLHATNRKLTPEYVSKNEKEKISQLLWSSYVLIISVSILLTFIVFLFAAPVSKIFFKKEGYEILMKIIAFSVFTNKFFETTFHNLTGFQKFTEISLSQILNGVIVRIYALSLYFSSGIEGYLLGLITGQFVISLWMLSIIRKYFGKFRFMSFKKLLKYSFPFYLNGYIRYGANHADSLIVGFFLKPEVLATYYVAKRFINYLEIYFSAILRPLSPKIIELKKQGREVIEKIFYRSTRYLSYTTVPPVFFLISISYFLLHIYGRGKYLSGIPVLIFLSLGGIITAFYSLFMGNVFSLGKPVETTKIEVVKSLVNVAGGLLIIKFFGILGIALTNLIAGASGFVAGYLILKKFITPKVDLKTFKNVFLISLLCGCIIGIPQFLFYSLPTVIISIFLGVSLFIFLVRNIMSEDDKKLFNLILGRKWREIRS